MTDIPALDIATRSLLALFQRGQPCGQFADGGEGTIDIGMHRLDLASRDVGAAMSLIGARTDARRVAECRLHSPISGKPSARATHAGKFAADIDKLLSYRFQLLPENVSDRVFVVHGRNIGQNGSPKL